MNYGRRYSDDKDELELALIQNSAVECDMYSIIASILRESENGKIISLRDVSVRRTTESSERLKGKSGFPDFVVLERVKAYNAKILGCVEIKRPTIELEMDDQIKGHIQSYGKVMYTNGLVWSFFDGDETSNWECELGTIENDIIQWNTSKKWFELLEYIDMIKWF